MFFGVRDGDSCFCGNDISKLIPAPASQCNVPCNGNHNEICGGSWRFSLYGPYNRTQLNQTSYIGNETFEGDGPVFGQLK